MHVVKPVASQRLGSTPAPSLPPDPSQTAAPEGTRSSDAGIERDSDLIHDSGTSGEEDTGPEPEPVMPEDLPHFLSYECHLDCERSWLRQLTAQIEETGGSERIDGMVTTVRAQIAEQGGDPDQEESGDGAGHGGAGSPRPVETPIAPDAISGVGELVTDDLGFVDLSFLIDFNDAIVRAQHELGYDQVDEESAGLFGRIVSAVQQTVICPALSSLPFLNYRVEEGRSGTNACY